jgi:hypothetical protein
VPALHHAVLAVTPAGGWGTLVGMLAEGTVGVVIGIAVLGVVIGVQKMRRPLSA